MSGSKDKFISTFKTNTPKKKTVCERGKKLNKLKSQKQSEENIINSIRNPFILKIENKEMKDRIIRDIRTLFEQDNDDYYKPKRVSKF